MSADMRALAERIQNVVGKLRSRWRLATVFTMLLVVIGFSLESQFGWFNGEECVPLRADVPVTRLVIGGTPLTRFFDSYNRIFVEDWKCKTGTSVEIKMVYAPSGDHMRNIIAGTFAPDVIALSNPFEMEAIAEAGAVASSWREEFPFESSPYYTALVFAVRSGNPKKVKDWEDLVRSGIAISVSDPRICGGGRWVYAGVLGEGGVADLSAEEYLARFYANVPRLFHDQAAAQRAFLDEGAGDVLVTYEASVLRVIENGGPIEMVAPQRTIQIDLPIAVARSHVTAHGTEEAAEAYVRGLYGAPAQKLIAGAMLRPRTGSAANGVRPLSSSAVFMRNEVFPDDGVERAHFKSGGLFDAMRGDR